MLNYYRKKTVFFKIGLFAFCMFTFKNQACSQTFKPDIHKWAFSLGFGLNNNSVIDNKFSSLPYSGNGLGASASISYQGKFLQQQLIVSYNSATLKNKYENSLSNVNFNGNYTGLFLLNNPANTNLKVFACPQISLLYTNRNYNGFLNKNSSFEFATSVAAALEVSYELSKLGILLKNRIAMPVISYVQQPAYGFETFFMNTNSQTVNTIKNTSGYLSFNSFSRITNNFTIDEKLAKQHKLLLIYQLDFYKINNHLPVKSNINTLTLTYCYLL